MTHCPKCSSCVPEDARFCSRCGASLAETPPAGVERRSLGEGGPASSDLNDLKRIEVDPIGWTKKRASLDGAAG